MYALPGRDGFDRMFVYLGRDRSTLSSFWAYNIVKT